MWKHLRTPGYAPALNVDFYVFITKIVKFTVVLYSFFLTVQSADMGVFKVREYILSMLED